MYETPLYYGLLPAWLMGSFMFFLLPFHPKIPKTKLDTLSILDGNCRFC